MKHAAGPAAAACAEKRRKANELRHSIPHATYQAIAGFVKFAKERDVSDLSGNARFYQRARDAELPRSAFGEVLTTVQLACIDGADAKDVVLVNPAVLIDAATREPGGFSRLFASTLRKHQPSPSAPWNLVLYADEVVPGNQISAQNLRKAWVMYFSFLEFGSLLADEDAWLPIAAEPSHGLKKVSGGVSQLFAAVVKQLFGAQGYDMQNTGIQVVCAGGTRARLFVILSMILQDGGAHKLVFSCKGDSGSKFCMLCKNVVALKSKLAELDGTHMLKANVIFEHELELATCAEIRGALARLSEKRRTCSNTDFAMWETAIGFSYHEHGLLQDASLVPYVSPSKVYCHDWMRGMMAEVGARC